MRLLLYCIVSLSQVSLFAQSKVIAKKDSSGIVATIDNKPVLYYHMLEAKAPADSPSHFNRSGFIHPLYSPSGKILTDDFPAGHAHQHGIFLTWSSTKFRNTAVDFWNQQSKKGTVKHEELLSVRNGKDFAEFRTKLAHTSLEFGKILEERWTIKIYNNTEYFVIDLESDQTNITKDTLFLNKYHYGGLAYRGSREWNEDDKKHFTNHWKILTNEGRTLEDANASHAAWIDASGLINQQEAGVTIFSDPSNFRHPQALRVHPTMDYFAFSPTVEEAFYIAPNQHYHSSYRIIAHDGKMDRVRITELYKKYLESRRK